VPGPAGPQGPKGDTGATGPAGTLPTPPWIAPSFVNGWRNYGSGFVAAGYRKIGDIVYFRGLLQGGASPSVAFTLPAGYLPPGTIVAIGVGDNTSANGRIDINTAGAVTIQSGPTGAAGYLSLDSVQFSVTA
jgi:hypothetical protein